MFGVFINVLAIVIGGIIGTMFKNSFPKKVSDAVMEVMGLISVVIGVQGAIKTENVLVVLIALVVGTIAGTFIDIDKYINLFAELLKKKCISKNNPSSVRFIEAFVSVSVITGIGAMAILGSIEAGIKHEYSIFFLKSIMDFISSIMFATTMGIGVSFAAITIFVLQGSMTLFASVLKPLADNAGLMNELTSCGNIIIIAIGLNVLGITKMKIANMIPALVLLPIIYILSTSIL